MCIRDRHPQGADLQVRQGVDVGPAHLDGRPQMRLAVQQLALVEHGKHPVPGQIVLGHDPFDQVRGVTQLQERPPERRVGLGQAHLCLLYTSRCV